MLGERKSDIFKLIPEIYLPKTILIGKGDLERAALFGEQIGFPLIAKPDIGERGTWVKKINDQAELRSYTETCPVDFLLQELVEMPIELGVFFIRYPNENQGRVTSIVRKDFLKVTGDGRSTVRQLLEKNPRAALTGNLNSEKHKWIETYVPKQSEDVLVEPIGNHCRGTKFLSDNHEIDEGLNEAFNKLADQIPVFYFGRFDLKCESYEELRQLRNFKILELNGAGAEPAHIYQPGYSLIKAYRDLFWHLGVLSDISAQNRKNGHSYWSFKRGFRKWKSHQRYNRLLASK